MRKTTRILSALLFSCGGFVAQSHAQLTEITWGGTTGTRDWHTTGNWVGGVVPNTSLSVANLAVNLGSGLTVDLGATDATIAQLRLGSKSNAVTSNVTGTTGRLIFFNEDEDVTTDTEDADFDNSTVVDGRDFLIWQRGFGMTGGVNINKNGDADIDGDVDAADLAIWEDQYGFGAGVFNAGAPGIESTGVAGVTNLITAPIHIMNQHVEIGGTRSLAIDGNITYEGDTLDPTVSNAGLEAMSAGQVVTINSTLTLADTTANENVDFAINNDGEAQGTIVMEGVVAGTGKLVYGRTGGSPSNLGTIVLKQANTFGGSVVAGLGNLRLEDNAALGTGSYTQAGPVVTSGYNLISNDDSRVIANEIVMAQWQTVSGTNSITFSGHITQTNNRGIINQLPAGKDVTISGDLDIWEDDEVIERRFVVDGPGRTLITGTISDDELGTTGQDRRIQKTGTGVLVIDVAAGANNHSGPEVVLMGNLHYADNDSLNVSIFSSSTFSANIRSIGGAVGVDVHPVGQTLATNATFLGKFDPTSTGGLMLAASDAAVNLDFSSAALNNVENMSLAAPETGITYTGTLTPNNDQYRLGGGTGTLTLPNAQLTGARSLSVRNGGTVSLQGSNSYTGSTTIESKYSSSNQVADENVFLDDLVDPVLEVNTLANGGSNSSIGASSNAAANLYFHAATLKYVGTGSTTDRLFTIGTGGATLDSSGTGAVVFSNTGAAVSADAADITGTLDDFTRNPNVIYEASSSRDVIVGMTARDPDGGGTFTQPPCEASGANCIPEFDNQMPPEPTVVTGVSDNGREIGLSANYPFILKENTRIVFGTVERTLTLTGSNTQANILSPVIANSAKGGVVDIVKQGTGTWLLEGVNTTTGATTVEAGTLGGNGGVGGSLTVNAAATFAPGGTGGSAVGDFSVGGSFTLSSGSILGIQLGGTTAGSYDVLNVTGSATLSGTINLSTVSFAPAIGNQFTVLTAAGGITDSGLTISGLTGFTKSIVGNSLVLTKTAALTALASVPEPSALVLMGVAIACCGLRRK